MRELIAIARDVVGSLMVMTGFYLCTDEAVTTLSEAIADTVCGAGDPDGPANARGTDGVWR